MNDFDDDIDPRLRVIVTQFCACLGGLVERDPDLLDAYMRGEARFLLDKYGLDDLRSEDGADAMDDGLRRLLGS